MGDVEPGATLPPPPPVDDRCYRHPDQATGVHCTRCGRAICIDCMHPAPVGHQCPECVREAKAEFRKGPGRRDAVARTKGVSGTTILLALLAAGYVWELSRVGMGALVSGPGAFGMFQAGGAIGVTPGGQPIGIGLGEYWRLGSSIFLHFGIIHLAVNAYSLYILGGIVESEFGRWRLIALFFATGLFASGVGYVLRPDAVAAGASGAVFGLLGVVLVHAYQRRGSALGAMRMRMVWQVLLMNVVITFVSINSIGWQAHLGGFVGGAIAGYLAERTRGSAVANAIGIAGVGVAGILIAVAKNSTLTAV